MNGIEYSALANVMNQQRQHQNRNNPVPQQQFKSPPIQSINNINGDFGTEYASFTTVASSPNQFPTVPDSVADKTTLIHRLQALVEPPEYLIPSLTYKNTGAAVITSHAHLFPSTLTSKRGIVEHKPSISSRRDYTDDFILVSEFSEIEGPRPLLTIPTDGATNFNKNEYSLHLMCVDFHSHLNNSNNNNNNNTTTATTTNSDNNSSTNTVVTSKFGLTKDTSIINYWDLNAHMVCACVHHFNLYDLEARGFVRPFCLAYVSFDQTPVTFFDSMRANFTLITDLFKRSNLNQFRVELEQRLVDLAYTRDYFLQWTQMSESERSAEITSSKPNELDARTIARLNSASANESLKESQLQAIDSLIGEMKAVMRVVVDELKVRNWQQHSGQHQQRNNPEKCSSAIDPDLYNDADIQANSDAAVYSRSFTYPFDAGEQLNIKIDGSQSKRSSKRRKGGHQLRKARLYPAVLLSQTLNFNINQIDISLGSSPTDTGNNTSSMSNTKRMKRLHELCEETAKKAINELRLMQRRFSMPHHLLKFDRMILPKAKPLSLQKFHSLSTRNLFWSVTFGDVVVADFSLNSFTHQSASTPTNSNKKAVVGKIGSSTKMTTTNPSSGSLVSNEPKQDAACAAVTQTADQIAPPSFSSFNAATIATTALTSDSVQTQFFSLGRNDFPQKSSAAYFDIQTNPDSSSWKNVDSFLQNEEKANEEVTNEENEDQFYSDDEGNNKGKESLTPSDEEDGGENEDLISNGESDEEESDEKRAAANEYDFANSLLTLNSNRTHYYQQQHQNISGNNQRLVMAHLLALSLASSSTALYYRTLAELKFSSTLGERLSQIGEFNFEATFKRLLTNHQTIMPHLIYSLLKGRPVIVIARHCADLDQLNSTLDCLSQFLPNSIYCLNRLMNSSNSHRENESGNKGSYKYTSSPCDQQTNPSMSKMRPELKMLYKRKPIRLNDLKYCKLFGLCLMGAKEGQCCSSECNEDLGQPNLGLHKHRHYHLSKSASADEDLLLKYIPITIRNYVSILDLDKQTFLGPKYNGSHLSQSLNRCKSLPTDSLIYVHMISHVIKFYTRLAFLCQYSILFQVEPTAEKFANKSIQMPSSSTKTSTQRKSSIQVTSSSNTNQMSRRDRILRFYSMSGGEGLNQSASNQANSSTTGGSSLIGSLFSYYYSSGDSKEPLRKSSLSTISSSSSPGTSGDIDVDLLRLVLAASNSWYNNHHSNSMTNQSLSSSNNSLLFVTPTPVQPNSSLSSSSSTLLPPRQQFEHSDLNIVLYLLKSMKIKQVLIYNLVMRRKRMRELHRAHKSTNTKKSGCLLVEGGLNVENTEPAVIASEESVLMQDAEPQIPLLVDYEDLTLFSSSKK